uniref:Uncharacterized protein n=1 Tax=Amphimedon queenslandica TaxID=400682 RepID=A0A1X7SN35_AMPQE
MKTDENDKIDSTTSLAATLDAANKELPGPSKRIVESKKAKETAQIDAAKSRGAQILSATTPLSNLT